MAYQVAFTARANRDVTAIVDWISERSTAGARRWLESLQDAQGKLAGNPLSFALAEESNEFPEAIRQILFRTRRGNTYRALFVVRGMQVTIVCVRGPGQPPVLPDELLT